MLLAVALAEEESCVCSISVSLLISFSCSLLLNCLFLTLKSLSAEMACSAKRIGPFFSREDEMT